MRLVVLTIAVLVLAGSASRAEARPASPSTSLTIVALNAQVGRAVFHLQCDPSGGDMPNPTKACAALAEQPDLITNPKPFVCRGGPQSQWLIKISGRFNEQLPNLSFSTCWTFQTPLIARFGLTWKILRKHLVPRRRQSLRAGRTARFPPGALRATDLVSCDILGHHLAVGVPVEAGGSATMSYGGTHPIVVLTVTHNRDGSVTARCYRWKPKVLPPAPSRTPLPDGVALSLSSVGIEPREASAVTRATLRVTGKDAVHIAFGKFGVLAHSYTSGWLRMGRVSVHLVRIVRTSSVGPLGLFPDQLVWMVVIRDVSFPIIGPPGRPGPQSYVGWLAMFVRTDLPRWIVATSF